MTKFLSTGQHVRREIHRIFDTETGRRVAIVAFVGSHADAYLPKPNGLELVCWPKAPGTNPKSLRTLIKKGVSVRFADRLHMKIYWTESKGAVVASANLSTNAYGAGDLKEAGVALPSPAINIDKLLQSLGSKEVEEKDLRRLEKEWTLANPLPPQPPTDSHRTFLDWLAMPKRRRWLLSVFDSYCGSASQRLQDVAEKETGSRFVEAAAYCRKGEVAPDDFLLRLNVGANVRLESWLYVHRVVLVSKNDKQYYPEWPYQAGQLYPPRACPAPPFRIDRNLRRAFGAAYKELGSDNQAFSLEPTSPPSKELLKSVEKHYRLCAAK